MEKDIAIMNKSPQTTSHLDFSSLEKFFSLPIKEREKNLFNWGQQFLLPLHGKALEKACADLTWFFRNHSEATLCPNLINDPLYWAGDKEIKHQQLSYAFKEYMMNILVYKQCEYICFQENNTLFWNTDNKALAEKKILRFNERHAEDRKKAPGKTIKISGFNLAQKDIIWCGISVGYLDVPELVKKNEKKIKPKAEHYENIDDVPFLNDFLKKDEKDSPTIMKQDTEEFNKKNIKKIESEKNSSKNTSTKKKKMT